MKIKPLALVCVLFIAGNSLGLAIDVLSGGSTDYVQGEYRAGWSYKTGWLDGGTVWYDPNSGDTWDFER